MAERTLPAALKTSLIANDPYTYFHLIKFEKPNGVTSSEFVSGKATDYAYITDSSINIEFNDNSKTSKGVANGDQIYVANKVLKVGTVNETTEAKASNMTLLLSGTAIGTIVSTNASFASSSMTTTTDLLEAGFQEGDVLLLESAGNTNNNKYARINKFTNANKTVSLTGIDCTLDNDATSRVYNLSYASEEISALLNNKEATNYTNYVNREVFVYRGHYHPDTVYAANGTTVVHTAGEIIGEPFLIFKGIISKGSVTEDVLKDSKVSWNLTSHWGDFVRVQGRLTSDYSHRALSVTGEADVGALIRPEYQYDLGFAHAERSINLIATYQSEETRYKMKKRGGLAGLLGMKKTVEYQVEVDREVDLQFNLSARSLPVVYGVQKVDSIPVFADIDRGNVKDVYVAHAFAEGEIGGIFDIHVSDTSSVCLDANDKTNRTASDGVSIACYGRADKGFVLAGQTGRTSQDNVYSLTADERTLPGYVDAGGYETTYRQPQSGASFNRDDTATGLQHETTFTLAHAETPTTLFIHTGKLDQDADDTLVGLASNKSFKLQNELSDINKNNYWSPNHRLLDTAYVVAKYTIGEGDTTIDKLEFVVSGKKVRSHNYDYSYDQDTVGSSSGAEFFNLADSVTIHRTHAEGSNAADSQIGSAIIIDKWSFYRDSDTLLHRFRLSSNPQETANVTAFYIKRTVGGAVKKWYMVSHDHKVEASTLTAGTPVSGAILGQIPAHTTSNGMHARRVISLVAASALPIISQTQVGHFVSINVPSFGTPTALFKVVSIDTSNSTITVNDNNSSAMENVRDQVSHQQSTSGGGSILRNHNIVNLSSDGSSANDAYNGRAITFTRFDANDNITHQEEKEIVDYAVVSALSLHLVTLARPMPFDFNPGTDASDNYTILSGRDQQDLRVSINPAIQLLDYLKNKRYGKGLEDKDINLPTFLQAARDCDTRSDVTIQTLGNLTDNTGSTKLVAGDVYKLKTTVAGQETRVHFQGTIKSVQANVVNIRTENSGVVTITPTTYTEVVFTDVIGKIAYKWNDWKIRANLDYFYHAGKLYQTTGGAVPNAPSSGHLSNDLNLTKVSGNAAAPTSLPMSINEGFTSSGNPIVKKFTNAAEGFNSPGYSLYDSDDVKYWKYLGWDDHEQRFVTRHQTNQIIDTSVPLFDNINSMLKQFNGVLRYSGGKYELAIKSASPSSFESFQTITDADIIGKIKLQDKGQKSTYNSMSANVIDPQNNYNARSISYFNSEYLKQDKGIRRSGQFAMPGISNYFNSRINIQQFLDESRYGLDVAFTLDSKAYLLLTGEIIQITNERFNWSNKLFRIDNLNFQANGLVQVTATEHNDAAYLIGNIKTPYGTRELETEAAGSAVPTPVSTPNGLTNLTATSGAKGAIDLAWTNSTSFNTATHTTEVWASSTNDRTNATLIYTTQSAKMSDIVAEQTLVTKYYWARHTVVTENGLVVPSAYFPASSTGGVQGTATGAIDGAAGARGPGRWHIQVSSLPTTSSAANTAWGSGSGSQPSAAVVNDQAWFHTGTVSSPTGQKVWIYAGSGNWTEQTEFIDGDLIVSGTVTADRMNVTTLSSITADIGSITAGTIKGGNIPDANASPSGSEAGAFMDLTGGKVVFGNASKHILFNGSSLVLSGVTIDETSVVNSTAGVIIQEDGSQEATAATTLNFTTGLNVAVTGSAPTQTATISLDSGFATLASPAFTGTPTAPTAAAGTNNTQVATTNYADRAVANLVDSAPSDLNTLNELAAALADDDAFSTTVNTALGNRLRVDTASQGLSSTQKTNALTNLAIQNINNTSDANKPVSTAQQTALNLKANIASPTFTGTPTAPTAGSSTNNTQLATTAFVQSVASGAAGGASGTTYTTSIPASTTKLRLTGSDSSNDDIEFVGSGATTVTRTNDSKFTISSTDNQGVTGVSGTAPIVSSGGSTPAISISAATTTAAGSMSAADKIRLNAIEDNATADQTASEILNLLKTVDSNTSGLNAATLDSQEGTHYLNYNNFSNTPTTITSTQASNITTNNAKVGITSTQASNITTNNAKVGITTAQANAITTNNAKVGLATNNVTNASVSGSTLTLTRQGASNVTFTDNNDNTTYDLSVAQNTDNTNNNPRLLLAGTNSTNDHITMIGGGAITTTRDSNTQFTISHSDTNSTTSPAGFSNVDSLATSGKVKLLAGISHDTYGHITGSNGLQLDFTGPVVEISSGVIDIVASTITATNINSRFANFGSMAADVASITNLTTDFLDADQIISKDIRVGASAEVTVANFVVGRTYKVANTGSLSQAQWNTVGGTTEKIYGPGKIFTAANVSFPTDTNAKADDFNAIALIGTDGTTLSGSGAHLNSDGDFFLGVHNGARIFFDQSAGTLTIKGTLDASDIVSGTLSANSINGISLDTGSNAQISIGTTIAPGNHSILIGVGSGGTGLGNTSIGKFAGGFTTGTDNVAIGQDAGNSVTTGSENIMIGSHTGRAPGGTTANKTGNNNIGIGAVSNQNTANGTLSDLTTGSNNIVFGKGAGRQITTGSGNVIIGGWPGQTTDENTITLATGGGSRRLYFDTSGNAIFTGTLRSGALRTTGILTIDTSPAANGTGDLQVIPSANDTAGVGFAGQVLGVNISTSLSSNAPKQFATWGGVTGSTAIALQADDNSYGQFQVWTAPQDSSANTVLTPRFWIAGSGAATFAGTINSGAITTTNTTGLGIQTSGYSLLSAANNARAASGSLRLGNGNGSTGLVIDYTDQGQTVATIRNMYVASSSSELTIQSPFITFDTGTSYTEALKLDHNQKATFAGDINLTGTSIIGTTTDTDTYLQFHSANQFRVVTNGAERLEVNTTGIEVTGRVLATEYDLPSSGKLDWANGDARIQEGLVNNYSLSFQTYDGSNLTTALRLDGDNEATFADRISSGDHIITTGTNGSNNIGLLFKTTDNSDAQKYIKQTAYYMQYNGHNNEGHHFTCAGTNSLLRLHGSSNGTRPNSVDITADNGLYMNNVQIITASRNLTSIGTISSGAITVTSTSNSAIYVSGNSGGLYFDGGNNRIFFSGYRALEGDTGGTNLQLGEGYTTTLVQSNLDLSSGHTVRINGTEIITSSRNLTNIGTINSGAIVSTGNITAFSDERLKSDIKTLDGKKVLEMRGVEFIKDGVKGSGVIAQELEKIAPELVHDGEYKSVAYGNITGYLIELAKEQQSEINELKDLVKQLLGNNIP